MSSFSSKKVSRAAGTGRGRRRAPGTGSGLGFYSVIVAIAILGTFLVVYSRNQVINANKVFSTPPQYEAFGVFLCDKFAPNINTESAPVGIGTQNDGVIHVLPIKASVAGKHALFNLFTKAVGLKVTANSVQMPADKQVYKSGQKCGGKAASFQVKEWTKATDPSTGRIVKGDPGGIRLQDNHALVLAFVPNGTEIPLPASAASLAQLRAAANGANAANGATTASTVPVVPSTPAPAPTPPAPTTTTAPKTTTTPAKTTTTKKP